ncbi:Phenylalanine--tRNA ligase beta subunit [Cytospora mali]|uniref:Phenylalanine--tRNA ligase beta subunit n=1 Tax=Cytospora mali TaxID=578113 RepID=A0A194VJN1_CYTMA|nr:Phenylalanine--tRNA ligase beta subunit [Valsa mali]
MPTITVDKYALYEALGQKFTKQEFEDLCFDFGIELDEDTEEDERPAGVPPELKIEIPANRYDMLCFEGIQLMLNIFRSKTPIPNFRVVEPKDGNVQTLTIKANTKQVRPYAAGAILRNITFTQQSYDSFISLQDKLHMNLARQRTLVAIGTHDLDTIQGPFTYDALPPNDIKFIPLNQQKSMTATELMTFYEKDKHLGKYLHIIKDAPVYPVMLDANNVVMSMPPIINGEHSKITLNTKNIFIDLTATDETKLAIVTNMMVTMFSMYCAEPFTVEPVKVIYEYDDTRTKICPDLAPRVIQTEVDYLKSCTGLDETPERICQLLTKMAYAATPSSEDKNLIEVSIPPTRADVLHQCDIMEDLAICYGYNNLPRSSPNKSATIGAPTRIQKLADIVRNEAAFAGWTEVLPLILCSFDENYTYLNRKDDGKAVRLANPKTAEYQVVRTSLLPGLLKTIRENKGKALPINIFECSDVVFKDENEESKARNQRNFAACYCSKTSGFEMVHGLMDRLLLMLRTAFEIREEGLTGKSIDYTVVEEPSKPNGYWIEEIDEPTFFHGHAAAIYLRLGGKTQQIGQFGILHPSVLESFEIKYPVSALEFNLEVFL